MGPHSSGRQRKCKTYAYQAVVSAKSIGRRTRTRTGRPCSRAGRNSIRFKSLMAKRRSERFTPPRILMDDGSAWPEESTTASSVRRTRVAGASDVLNRETLGCGDHEEGYRSRSEEHTSELQSRLHLVCRLLLEK